MNMFKQLAQMQFNWKTGNLATDYTPTENVTTEKYWKGSEPKEYDTQESLSRSSKAEDSNSFLNFFEDF